MEYITSRGFYLPTDKSEMENLDWFNMWRNRNFPYSELLIGDILYWFDTTIQRLVWKTEVIKVDRFPYTDKKKIFDSYPNSLGSEYYENRPDKGYFLGYKINVLEKLDIEKPTGFRFPQLGWLRVDNELSSIWINRIKIDDKNILHDNLTDLNKPVIELLADLNEIMKNVSQERIEKLISTTIRKDTKIVTALKHVSDYRCQFPDCGHKIIKKDGSFYIEVAHIKPVSVGGKSVLGNLIVLCPNHHKEFDFGDLKITEQTTSKLAGQLNGKDFEIEITNPER